MISMFVVLRRGAQRKDHSQAIQWRNYDSTQIPPQSPLVASLAN